MSEGSKGIFDVTLDGRLLYSRYKTGVFPKAGEITELIQKAGIKQI